MRANCTMTRSQQVVSGDLLSLISYSRIKTILFSLLFLVFNVSLFGQDVSVFQPTDGPANSKFNDGLPIETGMKFRSSQSGYIKGIRYYKIAGTTGVHTAHLWS